MPFLSNNQIARRQFADLAEIQIYFHEDANEKLRELINIHARRSRYLSTQPRDTLSICLDLALGPNRIKEKRQVVQPRICALRFWEGAPGKGKQPLRYVSQLAEIVNRGDLVCRTKRVLPSDAKISFCAEYLYQRKGIDQWRTLN